MEKKCTSCYSVKDLSEFNNQARGKFGKRSVCRLCERAAYKKWHDEKWCSDPAWKAKRCQNSVQWAENNPEKRSIIAAQRNKREKEKFPERVRCRALVNQRVRFGRMPKASSLMCVYCQSSAAHYHHHKGYSFESRYDVVPVCVACHEQVG
jgi:hypothetical protein